MEPLEWERQIWAKQRSKPPPRVFTSIMGSSTVSRDCTVHTQPTLLVEEKL